MSTPWLTEASKAGEYRWRSHLSVFSLVALLQELRRYEFGKELVLIEPPRSVVLCPESYYLFYRGSHRQLASFEMGGDGIISVGLRYNNPLDPNSGVNERIVSAWEGIAQLIGSAVRRSPFFGKLETIEVSSELMDWYRQTYSSARESFKSTYEIWVTPRRSWQVRWEDGDEGYETGAVGFYRNVPILLAQIEVERPVVADAPHSRVEPVLHIELYPDFMGALYDRLDSGEFKWPSKLPFPLSWAQQVATPLLAKPFMFLSMSDQNVLRLPPHSEFRINWKS